jgi:hypothetical protein
MDHVDIKSEKARPGWSKTVHSEPSAVIDLSACRGVRFMKSAISLVREMEAQGHPVGNGHLFRLVNKHRSGFTEDPLSANALRKHMIQQHLTVRDAGLYDEETLHNFRRSAVQNAASIEGFDVPKLMAMGRWKSYAAF